MIYESENLKNKRAIYEKRDKWLIRLAFLFWAVLLFILEKLVDCLEKCLIYGHIRRFAN